MRATLIVPACLGTMRDVHAYTAEGAQRKAQLHRHGRAFLLSLAQALGLEAGTYDIRSNKGGIAVSGEVTLHAESLYVQLSESCITPGISVLYRTCKGHRDCCGGTNHFATVARLHASTGTRSRFLGQCKVMAMGNYAFTVIGD